MMKPGALDQERAEPGSPWAGSQVLLFFCLFFLIQFLALQWTLSSAPSVEVEPQSLEIESEAPEPSLSADQARTLFTALTLGNLLLVGLILFYGRLWNRLRPETPSLLLGKNGTVAGSFKSGILACLAWLPIHLFIALLWGALLQLFGYEPAPQQAVSLFMEAMNNGDQLLIMLIVTTVIGLAPWIEELLFRGLLFRWLLGYRSVFASAVISGLFFGVIHDALASIFPIACLGVALAWLYNRTGSLLTTIVFHSFFNGIMLSIMIVAHMYGMTE